MISDIFYNFTETIQIDMKIKLFPESKDDRRRSLTFMAIGLIFIIVSSVIGLSDNLPMIFICGTGIILAGLAFVHHWNEIRKFQIFIIASFLGLAFFILMHNVFYGLAEYSKEIVLLPDILNFLSVIFFILAVLICPAGIVIGIIGLIYLYAKRKFSVKSDIVEINEPEIKE